MTDDGYTLIEMLVALVLVSLAVSAVAMTGRIVSRTEGRQRPTHATSVDLGRFADAAGAALRDAGPFTSATPEAFVGSPQEAVFDCGTQRCVLSAASQVLRFASGRSQRSYAVPALKQPGLLYISANDGETSSSWPPADREGRLATVVVADAAKPVLNLPVGREQSPSCVFAVSAKGCAAQVAP